MGVVKRLELGSRFGKWIVIKEVGLKIAVSSRRKQRKLFYLCLCKCGNQSEVSASHLRTNETKGCMLCRKNASLVHGMYGTGIYRRWVNIKSRCCRDNDKSFSYYGGRGIKLCDRWLKFENFYADMGDIPFEGAQLDRIDPDGNYEPSNCRWVTSLENNNNRRNSPKNRDKYITIKKEEYEALLRK